MSLFTLWAAETSQKLAARESGGSLCSFLVFVNSFLDYYLFCWKNMRPLAVFLLYTFSKSVQQFSLVAVRSTSSSYKNIVISLRLICIFQLDAGYNLHLCCFVTLLPVTSTLITRYLFFIVGMIKPTSKPPCNVSTVETLTVIVSYFHYRQIRMLSRLQPPYSVPTGKAQ